MKHRLDRAGDAPVPAGYKLITSEVDFLRLATSEYRLHIRGDILCDWASSFFLGRSIDIEEVLSPSQELMAAIPGLLQSDASQLLSQLGEKFDSLPRPISAYGVIQSLHPRRLWIGSPSVTHAAEWLAWLIESQPAAYLTPALSLVAHGWSEAATDILTSAYQAVGGEQAEEYLEAWLGICPSDGLSRPVEMFPLPIPERFKEKARAVWKEQIIESHGRFFSQLEVQEVPEELKEIAASEALSYFQHHPDDLDLSTYESLARHLSWQQLQILSQFVAPLPPSELPDDAGAVLKWYRDDYLPYRLWQHNKPSTLARQKAMEAARQFANWYLTQYPLAIAGGTVGRYLSFARSAALARAEPSAVTLLVVSDGLHVADAQALIQSLKRLTTRLTMVNDELAFAPLPTVTQFCKDALFKGVPPMLVDQVEAIGRILPENETPLSKLRTARNGEFYIWRVQEPDHTYHSRNSHDTLMLDIQVQLDGMARKIADLVEQVPADVMLQIVITSDHGRLLAEVKRELEVPDGFESHGRAAWGKADLSFPGKGFFTVENLAWIYGERFGLAHDVIIPLTESAFKTSDGRSGKEVFPHGGLFPEEVIVPWLILVRDAAKPNLTIVLAGSGDAGKQGVLKMRVVNQGSSPADLVALLIDAGPADKQALGLSFHVPALSERQFNREISRWPSTAEIKRMHVTVRVKQPNGLLFELPATLQLESKEIYRRDDTILEGLDL